VNQFDNMQNIIHEYIGNLRAPRLPIGVLKVYLYKGGWRTK